MLRTVKLVPHVDVSWRQIGRRQMPQVAVVFGRRYVRQSGGVRLIVALGKQRCDTKKRTQRHERSCECMLAQNHRKPLENDARIRASGTWPSCHLICAAERY